MTKVRCPYGTDFPTHEDSHITHAQRLRPLLAGIKRLNSPNLTCTPCSVLTAVVDKTAGITPSQGQWQVYYLGLARDGWTAASHAFAQETASSQPSGKNWRALGMRLLDLSQVDQDLAAWVS